MTVRMHFACPNRRHCSRAGELRDGQGRCPGCGWLTRLALIVTRLTVLLVALALAPAVASAEPVTTFAQGKQLVAAGTDNTLAGADAGGTVVLPLTYNATTRDDRTAVVAPLSVGPVDLKAGDVVAISARAQYQNDNTATAPNAPWTVYNGAGQWVVSEHWTLWLMGACSVRVGTSVAPNAGAWAIYQQEANWDNWQHYMLCNQDGTYTVPADMAGAYIYTRAYFVAGADQVGSTSPTAKIIGSGTGRAQLQVAVYR